MVVKLSQAQKEYLINSVLRDKKNYIKIVTENSALVKDKWRIAISDEIADEIREACLDMLPKVGFDQDYELTDAGKMLDEFMIFFILIS